MRTLLLIGFAAATALSSPAAAQRHGRHHSEHHERHSRDRHHYDRHDDRHHSRHRVYVGYRLPSIYYGPRYIVTNYRHYGLRAPGRYLRWIRYGSDLLLVDARRGIVVQVLPGRLYY